MTPSNQKNYIKVHYYFKYIFIGLIIMMCTFEILWLNKINQYEDYKKKSINTTIALTKIMVLQSKSIQEYCNLTNNQTIDIFKDYLMKDNFKHLKEIK